MKQQVRVEDYVPRNAIATARDKAKSFLPRTIKRDGRSFAVMVLVRKGYQEGQARAMLSKKPDKRTRAVDAEISWGRWIAICECGGAEVVDPDDPFFFCLSCENEKQNGKLRPVNFPDNIRAFEERALEMGEVKARNLKAVANGL